MGSSCYKQNIMFKTEEFAIDSQVKANLEKAELNYRLKVNDYIGLRVETNKGESLIDPNYQLRSEFGIQNFNSANQINTKPKYLIRPDSIALLPMVGKINLVGLTLYEADSLLRSKYRSFYKDPYVLTSIENRRVIVFNGSKSQVIPLVNENVTLIEVLALTGGVTNFSKAHNIRLIRGNLKNPYVEVIDLSTIEGMQAANLQVRSQDIVYVEPVRRTFVEATKDVAPFISLLIGVLTISVLLSR